MATVSLKEAHARLPDVLAELNPGEELLITEEEWTVAHHVTEKSIAKKTRQPGNAIGLLAIVSDDDAYLHDFRDYMPRL